MADAVIARRAAAVGGPAVPGPIPPGAPGAPAVIALDPAFQALFTAQNNTLQALLAAIPAPVPPVPAPVENMLITVLKTEVLPNHLHSSIPTVCSWRKKIHVLEPGFWVIVAINKPVALTRLDLVKDMGMPGEWVRAFVEALETHFPTMQVPRKNSIVESFVSIMKNLVAITPQIQTLQAALPVNTAAIRALAEQMVEDCRSLFRQAREVMIALDTEGVVASHGPTAGAIYQAMTQDLNGEGHLGDALALKQMHYHSTITRRPKTIHDRSGNDDNPMKDKGKTCRRCKQVVPFGGFAAHNKICTGKGVKKGGAKA